MFAARKKRDIRRKINTKESSLELDKSRRDGDRGERERGRREKRKDQQTPRPNARVLYAASAPPVMAPYDLARVFS